MALRGAIGLRDAIEGVGKIRIGLADATPRRHRLAQRGGGMFSQRHDPRHRTTVPFDQERVSLVADPPEDIAEPPGQLGGRQSVFHIL